MINRKYLATGSAKQISVCFFVGINLFAGLALAETDTRNTVYFTLPPSPQVLAAHLFRDEVKPLRTRSISFKKTDVAPEPASSSVALPILFHFGKTTMTRESIPFLDNVGRMLNDPSNVNRALVVEGHTDSVGSVGFNLALSERRALAIKKYLVSNYQINPSRLISVGKGESLLYNKANPKSGENRRVEFLAHSRT